MSRRLSYPGHGFSIMRSPSCAFGLGLLVVLGFSATALAQQAPPPGAGQPYPTCNRQVTPDEAESAHQKYIAGKVDYDEARYDSAIERFRDAYAKDCTKHDLLIIISRAYEQRGDRQEAIRALEEYIKRVPSSPDKSTYEKRAATLRDALEKEKQQKAAAPPPPSSSPNPPPSGGSAPAPAEKSGGHTVPPWIVASVGGAAMVTGAIVLVAAPKLPPNCDEATSTCKILDASGNPVSSPTQEQKDQLAKDQDSAGKHVGMTTGGLICIIGGAGLLAGGLVWHFLEPAGSSSGSAKPKLTPAIAPGYAGLSLGASF